MIKILLQSSKHGDQVMIVDSESLSLLAGFEIGLSGDGKYCGYHGKDENGYVHRLICGAKKTEIVDHKNGNGLDNRVSNLRLTNKAGNEMNKPKRKNTRHSKYKGVILRDGKFRVRLHNGGKVIHCGTYPTEAVAAYFYNEFGRELYGEFLQPNIIPPEELERVDLTKFKRKQK